MKAKDVQIGGLYSLSSPNYLTYGYQEGDVVRVTYKNGASVTIKDKEETMQQLSVPVSHLSPYTSTKESIERQLAEYKEKQAECEARLKWMKETKTEVYDEDEFKVWQVLSTLDGKASKLEKTRAIAKLLKK